MAVKHRKLMMGWVVRGKMVLGQVVRGKMAVGQAGRVGDDREVLLAPDCCPKRWVGWVRACPVALLRTHAVALTHVPWHWQQLSVHPVSLACQTARPPHMDPHPCDFACDWVHP